MDLIQYGGASDAEGRRTRVPEGIERRMAGY